MDLRQTITDKIIRADTQTIFVELATGVGKTKIALDKIKSLNPETILIVVPKNVLIENWKKEFKKWDMENYLISVEFINYVSLHKTDKFKYDVVVFDEGHRFSPLSVAKFKQRVTSSCNIILSATIPKSVKYRLIREFPDNTTISLTSKQAMDNEILPTPEFIFFPMALENIKGDFFFKIDNKKSTTLEIPYSEKWKIKNKSTNYIIRCNAVQYHELLLNKINYFDKLKNIDIRYRNSFLKYSLDRLKWFSEIKEKSIEYLLSAKKDKRILVFCKDTEQCKKLCKYDITSANKKALKYLEDFNKNKINHISTCKLLSEGMNLNNCEYGVFAYIGSSEIKQVQDIGRILRHPNPKLVYYYFKNTREEEIIESIKEKFK